MLAYKPLVCHPVCAWGLYYCRGVRVRAEETGRGGGQERGHRVKAEEG